MKVALMFVMVMTLFLAGCTSMNPYAVGKVYPHPEAAHDFQVGRIHTMVFQNWDFKLRIQSEIADPSSSEIIVSGEIIPEKAIIVVNLNLKYILMDENYKIMHIKNLIIGGKTTGGSIKFKKNIPYDENFSYFSTRIKFSWG
ncbi:MAG: hypothetical protein ABFS43_05220 [Thermodesulfobacteriota bacterium]